MSTKICQKWLFYKIAIDSLEKRCYMFDIDMGTVYGTNTSKRLLLDPDFPECLFRFKESLVDYLVLSEFINL